MAKNKDKEGWIFTLDYPSYVPFVTYAEDRDLRKKMSLAFGKRGFQNNENNNEEIILKIVRLKKERANLLGYDSHADFVLEERMAQSASIVNQFLDDLHQNALPFAEKEWNQIEEFANNKLNLKNLQKWDTAFVSEKLKQELETFNKNIDVHDLPDIYHYWSNAGSSYSISHCFRILRNISKLMLSAGLSWLRPDTKGCRASFKRAGVFFAIRARV